MMDLVCSLPGGCGRALRYHISSQIPPCPGARSRRKQPPIGGAPEAQVYPSQWEMLAIRGIAPHFSWEMLQLQATLAGQAWDSPTLFLVLWIHSDGLDFFFFSPELSLGKLRIHRLFQLCQLTVEFGSNLTGHSYPDASYLDDVLAHSQIIPQNPQNH